MIILTVALFPSGAMVQLSSMSNMASVVEDLGTASMIFKY